jgi:sulfur-oxidizing protein SoxY
MVTMIESRGLRRRDVMAFAASLAALGAADDAGATPERARALLQALVKGEAKPGKVTIRAPEIAENGNAVSVVVGVESPMLESDYVKAIHVVADGNPNPGVVSVTLTPASGRAQIDFRCRLAQTQRLVAVAEMSDGSLWSAAREVKVTVGGCTG